MPPFLPFCLRLATKPWPQCETRGAGAGKATVNGMPSCR